MNIQSHHREALLLLKAGRWQKAHSLVDDKTDVISAHIHAHIHRVEGDLWNARYWYRRAGKDEYTGSLESELNNLFSTYGLKA